MVFTKEHRRKSGFLLADRSVVNINGQRATLEVDAATGSIRVILLDKGNPLNDDRDLHIESSSSCLSELTVPKAAPRLGLAQEDCSIVDTTLLTISTKHGCPPQNPPDIALENQVSGFIEAAQHKAHTQSQIRSTLSDTNIGTATDNTNIIGPNQAQVPLAKFRPEDGDLRRVEQQLEREVLEQDLLEQFLSCVPHDFPFSSTSSSSVVMPDPPSSAVIEPGLFMAVGSVAKGAIAACGTSAIVDQALKGPVTSSYAFFMDAELKAVDQTLPTIERIADVTHAESIAHTDSIPITQTEVGRTSAFADWTFPDTDKESYEVPSNHRPTSLLVSPQPKNDFHIKRSSSCVGAVVHPKVEKRGRKLKIRNSGSFAKLKPLRPKPTMQQLFVFDMASAHSTIPLIPGRSVQTTSMPTNDTNKDSMHKSTAQILRPHMAHAHTTNQDALRKPELTMPPPTVVLVGNVLPVVATPYTQSQVVLSETSGSGIAHSNSKTSLGVSDSVVHMSNSDIRVSDAAMKTSDSTVALGVSAVKVNNFAVGGSSVSGLDSNNPVMGVADSALKTSSSAEAVTMTTITCPACHMTVSTGDFRCHLLTHRTVCVVCEAVFEREEQLFEHLTRHNIRVVVDADGSTELQCSVCRAHFLHAGNVQRHVLSHCEPRGQPAVFALQKGALNGQVVYSKKTAVHPKKVICHKCGKLLGPKSLVVHIKSHCPADDPDRHTNPMQCNECKNLFRNLTTLKRHLVSCRRRMAGTSMDDAVACDSCFRSVSVHSLATHKRLYCAAAEPNAQMCAHCGTVLRHKHSLRNHVTWHCRKSPHATRPTKCACGKVFRNFKAFQSHYQNHCLVRGPAEV